MDKLMNVSPKSVFRYFEEISAIPRGSGNCKKISDYCVAFAKQHGLTVSKDDADNVVIVKPASEGYEGCEPVILQGHLDMVCQKDQGTSIDFDTDGISLYRDGDFIKADGTTLGADNGIAVAMMLAILEDKTLSHPPIEAVFTSDEEIGLLGAMQLSMDCLKGRRMINLDAEDPKTVTVSCAGGRDFIMTIPITRHLVRGKKVVINIQGLKGGHSGVEIHKGRVNANMLLGRILNHAKEIADFEVIRINGGDKGNAIPLCCTAELLLKDPAGFCEKLQPYLEKVQAEIADREKDFTAEMMITEEDEFSVLDRTSRDALLLVLLLAPNGVIEMSATIENLVETSLNLGILNTKDREVTLLFSLRSNKESSMEFLEEKLSRLATHLGCQTKVTGHYPPWEYREDSALRRLYIKTYQEQFGKKPEVVAIHAGLECGVFASAIEGIDCIAIGPEILDVHTTSERLSVSSTKQTYELLLKLLEQCR